MSMKLAPATGSTEVTMNQYFENTLTAIHSSFSKLSMKLSDKPFFFSWSHLTVQITLRTLKKDCMYFYTWYILNYVIWTHYLVKMNKFKEMLGVPHQMQLNKLHIFWMYIGATIRVFYLCSICLNEKLFLENNHEI